jgi:hypothetical protein
LHGVAKLLFSWALAAIRIAVVAIERSEWQREW